jgi:hypothetical protein
MQDGDEYGCIAKVSGQRLFKLSFTPSFKHFPASRQGTRKKGGMAKGRNGKKNQGE